MVLGDFSKVVNAQNVTLQKGSSIEIITIFNIVLLDESIIDRRHPRAGALDTPTFSMIEITADAVISEDTYIALRAMRQLSTRGALPTDTFKIVATAISTATDDFTETGTFILRRMESKAPERGRYEVNITLRLFNNNTLTKT